MYSYKIHRNSCNVTTGWMNSTHSFQIAFFGPTDGDPVCKMNQNVSKYDKLTEATLPSCDKCTMATRQHLETLRFTMKNIRNDVDLFGGGVHFITNDFKKNNRWYNTGLLQMPFQNASNVQTHDDWLQL